MHMLDGDRHGREALLATVAHELRNGIAPLSHALEVLARTSDASARGLALALARRQLHAMNHMVAELTDFGQAMAGQVQLQRRPLVLQELVGQAVQACRPAFDARRQQLTTELAEAPLVVSADADRLWQVLVNLLNNASKFTPAGGHVAVMVDRQDHSAEVRIADDGAGIDRVDLERIFELFERGQQGRSPAPRGLGIGLAVVRRFVELHGGTVGAASAGPGQGATFTVRLPLAQAAAAAVAGSQPAAAALS